MTTMPKIAVESLARVEAIVREYVEVGVAIIEQDYTDKNQVGILSAQPLKTFLRRVAKEMKRPFVVARATHWHPWEQKVGVNGVYGRNTSRKDWCADLRLPNQKRFEPLIAALFLVSVDRGRGYRHSDDNNPATYYRGKTYIEFDFRGEAGREVFTGFLEQCRTNPVFKVCLRTS